MLEVSDITAGYGNSTVLTGVSLSIERGEAVTVLGANGAGKSTLIQAIAGLTPIRGGEIRFEGERIHGLSAARIVRRGLVLCPEGRHLFPQMSVRENLMLGAYSHKIRRSAIAAQIDEVLEIFPALKEKRTVYAGSLSGGEQQMVAIGRALMAKPRLLLLDEPSLGLAPLLVQTVMRVVGEINQRGIAIGLVEQNAAAALELVSRGYVLEAGSVVIQGSAQELSSDDRVRAAYLGVVEQAAD
ncbi:ABC transporter ATP-binding protein [Spongiactinospora gelatinilytica]|uniref:ABC transporter ATP-binding protein n=1 Tax=Spongiactinospora gelatinilytica TaxID=2666298 RepID=A0A2W2H8I8_9ACTN|nr:ABC transporter ATP-binding protein [Spongiactinospora gelatinilytica]PZG57001.1 ABC transporter ATP-binding protein [Spongiactinospora gelatinilytica]